VTAATGTSDVMVTADGVPLKVKLRRAERRRKLWALALIAPLFIFLVVTFIVPILQLLTLSVEDPEISGALPETAVLLGEWDGEGFPPPETIATFVREVAQAQKDRTIGQVARRMNYDITGLRSTVVKTGKKIGPVLDLPPDQMLDALIAIDRDWGDSATWGVLKTASPPLTDYYMLWALDRTRDVHGDIVPVNQDRRIYVDVLIRTVEISFFVTFICFAFGLPISYLLATLPTSKSNLLLILLLLPFWTSLLVRTTAWLVLLQSEGLVNELGIWIGLWNQPLELVRNRLGVYIAMVHILLPFMALPMFSVMKSINPWHMRAAISLGATPFASFMKVYMPQCLPGIGAGCLLVFILSLGYYITPALVGGPNDQMISYFIVSNTNQTLNWGLAAALSVILLGMTLVMFLIYNRLVGVDRLKLG
jgi:putative spermidine/putrescine transport system permease protein